MDENLLRSMKFLANVPSQNYFILSNGKSIENLEGMYTAIKDSDDSVFYHHVTPDRNDFANWIKYCVQHEDLYARLVDIKQKEVFMGVLAEEIANLKNVSLNKDSPAQESKAKPTNTDVSAAVASAAGNNGVSQSASGDAPTTQAASTPQALKAVPVVQSVQTENSSQSNPQSSIQPSSQSTPQSTTLVQPAQPNSPSTDTPSITTSADNDPKPPSSGMSAVIDEVMEFEKVLKTIIEDVEKEISAWEG